MPVLSEAQLIFFSKDGCAPEYVERAQDVRAHPDGLRR